MERKTKTILKYVCPAVSLFISGLAFAETTYTYLVRLGKTSISSVAFTGRGGKQQILWETKSLLAPNTNYALVQVTPSDIVENNQLRALEILGKTSLVSMDEITTGMTRGENVTVRQRTEVQALPADFYKTWVSSK